MPAGGEQAQHLYARAGTYTISALDAAGQLASTTFEAKAPVAKPPDFLLRGDDLRVQAELTRADNVPVLVIWE